MLTREPELRFHHLLCLPLFQGKGYSDGFSVNMQSVKDRLESEDTAVRFVCRGDVSTAQTGRRTVVCLTAVAERWHRKTARFADFLR